jgi:hypothetical protein
MIVKELPENVDRRELEAIENDPDELPVSNQTPGILHDAWWIIDSISGYLQRLCSTTSIRH